jgi:hypothetical protein
MGQTRARIVLQFAELKFLRISIALLLELLDFANFLARSRALSFVRTGFVGRDVFALEQI